MNQTKFSKPSAFLQLSSSNFVKIIPELGTFSSPPPHTFQDDVFAINYISIVFPMKKFSFKFVLRVIV